MTIARTFRAGCLKALTSTLAIGATAATFTAVQPAAASMSDTSGSARINLSGKLRIESQSIVQLACHAARPGPEQAAARAELAEARDRFVAMASALRVGDPRLGLSEREDASRVTDALDVVDAAWAPASRAVDALVAGNAPGRAIADLYAAEAELAASLEKLFSAVGGVHSNARNFPTSAVMAINVVLRQRTLLEQMDKAVCTLGAEGDAARVEELKTAIDVFASSLSALQNGMPAVGLVPPPNDTVRELLAKTEEDWRKFAPIYEVIAASGKAGPDILALIDGAADALDRDLQNVALQYLLATPGQADIYRIPLKTYAESQLAAWIEDEALIAAVKVQNTAHADLDQDDIIDLDNVWRAERKTDARPVISEMMARPLSRDLAARQDATAGLVTEVFVMDNRGLNVGQSAVTSDLWQGDEAKFLETFATGLNRIHISEVEFDDSTGLFQAQVSMPIRDPGTNTNIGAVTFGINVQPMM
ncbi:MAG: type IV pili methyl-accepting chemotaxis transducer N-terminal domain-containing protein [Pseudomonadota bacterium]